MDEENNKRGLKTKLLREQKAKVIELSGKHLSQTEIAEEMTKIIGLKVTQIDISDIMQTEKAKAYVYGSEGRIKNANKTLKVIQERYKSATDMVDWLVNSIEKIKKSLDGLPEEEAAIKFIKLAPVIIQTSREIINQLEYIKTEQENIKIEQNNLILSPIEVNIQMTRKLKEWHERGYIRILKKIPEATQYGQEPEEKNEADTEDNEEPLTDEKFKQLENEIEEEVKKIDRDSLNDEEPEEEVELNN
jgi:hypothetical protein